MPIARTTPTASDDAMIAALDRSLRRQQAETAADAAPLLRRMAGAPAAPGIRPERHDRPQDWPQDRPQGRQPASRLPLPLDADILDIERLDETETDRFADLDVHFGRHRWSDDGF